MKPNKLYKLPKYENVVEQLMIFSIFVLKSPPFILIPSRIRETWAACTHSDDDDAGLSDDLLGQVVEDGVRVVIEGLQFLHPVVQMEVRSKVLVRGTAYCWRMKLHDCVVFLVGVLNESKEE